MATVTELGVETGGGPIRRASALLHRHPALKLGVLLAAPLAWMLLIYLASLAVLLTSSFWGVDPFTRKTVHRFTLDNYQTLVTTSVYRVVAQRTFGMAIAVTAADIALAFPIAYYAARIPTPRGRAALLVAVTIPLWASYLVRA